MKKQGYKIGIRVWSLLLLLFFIINSSFAQKKEFTYERFHLGLKLGANLAQIDGDPYKGYRKWGMVSGVEGIVDLGKRKQLSVGVLFSQNGSSPNITERKRDRENYLDFRLTYIDIPLLLHFMSSNQQGYFASDFHLGLSLSRLLSSRITTTETFGTGGGNDPVAIFEVIDQQDAFKSFSANFVLGYARSFHPNLTVEVRHFFALTPFFKPEEADSNLDKLRSFYFSFGVNYLLR